MAYKEIVVHVGPDERSAVRLDAAVELAERHEGKVTGIYVLSLSHCPRFRELRALHGGLQAAGYRTACARRRSGGGSSQSGWRSRRRRPNGGSRRATPSMRSRRARTTPTSPSSAKTTPTMPTASPGWQTAWYSARAAPCWSGPTPARSAPTRRRSCSPGTAPARRSVRSPTRCPSCSRRAGLSSSASTPATAKHIPGADVCAYLARHGVSAEARHTVSSSDLGASDALLSEISDLGAGLLVMGGYGHHRMREVLLGRRDPRHPAPDDRAGRDVALAGRL